MRRTARCHCGLLSADVVGEPLHIFMCHCEFCQRRTGSSYHLDAWFPDTDVVVKGMSKEYVRHGERGDVLEFHFCPGCGSNVFFVMPQAMPGMIAIAVGCFADPEFPAPTMSIYGRSRHRWLSTPEGVPSLEDGVK